MPRTKTTTGRLHVFHTQQPRNVPLRARVRRGRVSCHHCHARGFVVFYRWTTDAGTGWASRRTFEEWPQVVCSCTPNAYYGIRHEPVNGELREDVPCDARCTGAVGLKCSCSCGGKNHGRDNEL